MASLKLSTDQFIALEQWIEAHGRRNSSGPGCGPAAAHRARQRAFTLLTGLDARPVAMPEIEDFSDLA